MILTVLGRPSVPLTWRISSALRKGALTPDFGL